MIMQIRVDNTQKDIKKALLNVMADLKETIARNEAILAGIADGVIVVNRSGVIVLTNNSAEKMLGWPIQKAIGKKWWQILKREDREGSPIPPEKGAIRDALLGGVTHLPSLTTSSYYVRKDGSRFAVARTVSPIKLP